MFILTLLGFSVHRRRGEKGSPTLTSLKCLPLIFTILVDFLSCSPLSTRFTDSRVKKTDGWRRRWQRERGNLRELREEDKDRKNERIKTELLGWEDNFQEQRERAKLPAVAVM